MPQSKSKRTARAVRSDGSSARKIPVHPAMGHLPDLVQYRLGSSEPLRLPDEHNDHSAAKVLRSEYTVSSDAAGHAVFGESFNISGAKMYWGIAAGITSAVNTSQHPQYAAFVAEARTARMVAMRIHVLYIGAEQTSAGYLSYEEKYSSADVGGLSIDSLHTGSDIQCKAQDGLVAYIDYTQLPRWESPVASSFMEATFPCGIFIASGLPVSTPLFRVRVERFMEYLPIEGTLSEGEVRAEPHDPGALGAHGALSGPATSVHTHSGMDRFKSLVKSAANSAFHMVQPLVPYVVDLARAHLTKTAMSTLALML